MYLDGFAGPRIYSNGEPGSPLIAIDTLVNHTLFDQVNRTEFLFLLVEGRKDRAERLEKEIEKSTSGSTTSWSGTTTGDSPSTLHTPSWRATIPSRRRLPITTQ